MSSRVREIREFPDGVQGGSTCRTQTESLLKCAILDFFPRSSLGVIVYGKNLDFVQRESYITDYEVSTETLGHHMTKTSEKIRAKMANAQADALREARRVQALASDLSKAVRAEDTRRKILEGVTASYGCEHSEEYRKLHEQFRARALILHKDRAVFGLPLLSEEEIERRSGSFRKAARKKGEHADASASRSDGFADAPATQLRETEAA
jgi:hypothetical protein